MRSGRGLLVVAGAILALTVFAISVSASSSPHALHITKDCSKFTGVAPTYCTIAASNLGAIRAKAKVWYNGPVLNNSYFLSSNVVIDTWHGNTATGYCNFDAETSDGICTFWKGTGTLTGFHAVVHVTVDSKGLFHWDGTYYFPGKP
ncbi:MAG: hypothetical protein Q7S35_12730 [Candidatus Limnocylindrales bacterium]|nr:hypothetical protein [Candidatus Limnocylindrales bacterium]